MRDHHGKTFVFRTDFMEPCLSVPEGEAWALAAATRFIAERGYQNVMFEVGSNSIVDKINRVQWIILSWITRSNNEGVCFLII